MKRGPAFLLLTLVAGLACLGGAWVEGRPWAAEVQRRMRSPDVPSPLLDYGRLGALLQRNDLVAEVANDGAVFPETPRGNPEDPNPFRRKSRVDDTLYRATPAREPGAPPSALPPELRDRGSWTIVSIAAAEEDLHGPDGILTRYTERIERRAHTTIYRGGVELFATRAGLKLHGGGSRLPERKSSYRLHLRDRYGSPTFPPGLLFAGAIDPVSTVIVRRTLGFTSVLAYDLARRLGSAVPAFEPCLLYLNGEPQGVHFLTERLDREQMRVRLEHDDFLLFRQRAPSNRASLEARDRLQQWLLEAGGELTVDEVARYLDVDALSRYVLAIAFCGTDDWEQGAALLDLLDPTARWKWIHWDMDKSFYAYEEDAASRPAFARILDPAERTDSIPATVVRALVDGDPAYRRDLAVLTCETLNHVWTPEFLRSAAQRYVDLELSLGEESEVRDSRLPFLAGRPAFLLEDLRSWLEVGPVVTCEVAAPGVPDDLLAGLEVTIDGYPTTLPYRGRYLAGQSVRARVTGAREFRGWEVDGRLLPDRELELVLEADTRLCARFD